MVNSVVAICIVVFTALFVSHFVRKIQLDHYSEKPLKFYFIRASIGIVPAFLIAAGLFLLFTQLVN